MIPLRRTAIATVLAIALAACGGDGGDGATTRAEAYERIAAPAGQSWEETAVETPEGGILLGNPDAPVKLVEYVSHTCPACAAFAAEAAELLKSKYISTGVVSYEMRNQIHNALDLALVQLTRCSGPQAAIPLAEQAWANLPQIMAPVQQDPQVIERAMALPEAQRFPALAQGTGLTDFFAARGIAVDQQTRCLSDFAAIQAVAERSDAQSKELNVTGTPTFILNGRNIGSLGWPEVEANLQNAGAR
jgi:protein-disulfide isomerase